MISSQHSASLLPWLAVAVITLYVTLFALRFIVPPASVKVEILSVAPSPAGK